MCRRCSHRYFITRGGAGKGPCCACFGFLPCILERDIAHWAFVSGPWELGSPSNIPRRSAPLCHGDRPCKGRPLCVWNDEQMCDGGRTTTASFVVCTSFGQRQGSGRKTGWRGADGYLSRSCGVTPCPAWCQRSLSAIAEIT